MVIVIGATSFTFIKGGNYIPSMKNNNLPFIVVKKKRVWGWAENRTLVCLVFFFLNGKVGDGAREEQP